MHEKRHASKSQQIPPSHISGTTERCLVDNKTLSCGIEGQIQSRFVLFASYIFVCKHWNINNATRFNAQLHMSVALFLLPCLIKITTYLQKKSTVFFFLIICSRFDQQIGAKSSCHLRNNSGKTWNEYLKDLLELVLGQLNQKNKLSNTWKKRFT